MLGGHLDMTGLPMLDGFLQMLDPFIQMRIFHILLCRFGMMKRAFRMLHQGIAMPLLAMGNGFLRMLDRFSDVLIVGQRKPGGIVFGPGPRHD